MLHFTYSGFKTGIIRFPMTTMINMSVDGKKMFEQCCGVLHMHTPSNPMSPYLTSYLVSRTLCTFLESRCYKVVIVVLKAVAFSLKFPDTEVGSEFSLLLVGK